jgi:hypothetical protein
MLLTTSVIANPKFDKFEANIDDLESVEDEECGKVIYNTNDENDDESIIEYEMEIEVEECLDLAAPEDETIDHTLTFRQVDYPIEFDDKGNGKITIYVDEYPTEDEEITINDTTLIIGELNLWSK